MTDDTLDAQLLGALLEAIPDAVLMCNATGTITRANDSAALLFGHDVADMIGASVNTLMPEALADRHEDFMDAHLTTGKNRIIGKERTVEGLRSDGSVFPLQLSIGRADHAGQAHFIGILHDLSERIATDEALARSARLDAIGQMTGGISHDFSNILTIIMGNLELLQGRLDDEENQAMLSDALEAAELGAELTTGLNTFASKTPQQFEPVDVSASCNAAISLIRRTFDPKYLMTVQLSPDLPAILSDSTQLQSAIVNLALNARDAMPDGGKLILRSERVDIDDSYIAQELDVAQGTYIRLTMTDTGRGMGPDTQQRALEPFYTTKPVGQGTGLGLAMVYGFVRRCGGHVTVYSELGIGTTIGLYFPVAGGVNDRQVHKSATKTALETGDQKILIVEDNTHLRKLSVARLNDLGYQVCEAVCGDSAADILRQDPTIDAVFTDLVMPGDMDGLALARHIVATYPHIRILLTSGYAEDILPRHQNDLGHHILRKPYRQSDLAKALERLF